jgi:glutamate synthase (NADPH/NADH) large chain
MTGGRVVILGTPGLNFAAGMSGGIAYVWDTENDFVGKCNMDMVDLDPVEIDEDIAELFEMIECHEKLTGSGVARKLLDEWPSVLSQFVKVMPVDYKRVLSERQKHDEATDSVVHEEPHGKSTAVGN